MSNHLKYWLLVLTISYGLTFAVQYGIRPLWFAKKSDFTYLPIFALCFTSLLLPFLSLSTIYFATTKMNKRKYFGISALIVFSCVYLSARLGFLNWADSVGSRTHPDTETLMIVAFERDIGFIVTAIGVAIAFIRLYKKNGHSDPNFSTKAST